jgi:hypothetical protein
MGKSLKVLLNDYNFQDKKFNPRNVNADMLSPLPDDKFQNDVKQIANLVKNSGDIYGKDIVRITTQGKVDTKKLTKTALKVTGNLIQSGLGLFGKVGKAAGSAINDTLNTTQHPLLPSDLVVGNNVTDGGLYAKLAAGNINNQKTAVGNFLSGVATPQQFKQNIGPAAVSAASSIVLKGLGKLASKLSIASAASNLPNNSNLVKSVLLPNFLFKKPPSFPSNQINAQDILKEKKGLASNQQQLVRDGGFVSKYDTNKPNEIKIDGLTTLSTGVNPTDYLNSYKEEITTFATGSVGKMQQYDDLGFNSNDNIGIGVRRQSFTDGLKTPYKLQDGKRTKQGNSLDGFLIVKDGEKGIYKIPDIIKEGKPKRFSGKASVFGKPNVSFFGGYEDRKASDINKILGDHRELSEKVLDNQNDLITISIYGIHLMANITGLTDTPTPTWGEAKPVGSPYKFYFYESFDREISFKAQLYAMSEAALPKVWKKVNSLMQLTKGVGGNVGGIRGSIVPLKIGNIINSEYGFLTSCTMTVPDVSPWEIKNGSQAPFVCELDIVYKVIQNTNLTPFYNSIKDANYKLNEFPSTAPPALKPFPLPNVPKTPTIDIKKVGAVNPLNSPTRQTLKANLAASRAEGDLAQTAAAEKYLADTAGGNSATPLILNNPQAPTNFNPLPQVKLPVQENKSLIVPPQNFGKQPEYDSKTRDYKRNIFGQVKLYNVRGVDNNPN